MSGLCLGRVGDLTSSADATNQADKGAACVSTEGHELVEGLGTGSLAS